MKKTMLLVLLVLFAFPTITFAQVNVRGHYRDTNRDGVKDTYVQPYQRTAPNSLRTDNYSYPGQYNPNKGSFTPYSSSPRENYPTNPNPYDQRKSPRWR